MRGTYSERVTGICRKYDIATFMEEDLCELRKYEIILICDDSSSMKTLSDTINKQTGRKNTRWDELKEMVEIVVDIGGALDEDGIDIWFLNRTAEGPDGHHGGFRTPFTNITTLDQVKQMFIAEPCGGTPLTNTLQQVMATPTEKPKLIIIATDGLPTDGEGYTDIAPFERLMKQRDAERNRFGVLICTDDESTVKVFNRLDEEVHRLDVIDDFETETEHVKKVQGKGFSYSYGTHVARVLLGPIFQKYDDMDERKLKFDAHGRVIGVHRKKGMCTIM